MDGGFAPLVDRLRWLERAVVAAESLARRLPSPCLSACIARILAQALGNKLKDPEEAASSSSRCCSDYGASSSDPVGATALTTQKDRGAVYELMRQGRGGRGVDAQLASDHGDMLLCEWVIDVAAQGGGRGRSRMYTRLRKGELRIATMIAAET